jgi:hypothetical protein
MNYTEPGADDPKNHMLNEVRVGSFYFPMLLRPSPFHA